jgi:hypothetical protein
MADRGWIDVDFLQCICRHTIGVAACVVSDIVVFWLIRFAHLAEWLKTLLDWVEQASIVGLLFYLICLIVLELREDYRGSHVFALWI